MKFIRLLTDGNVEVRVAPNNIAAIERIAGTSCLYDRGLRSRVVLASGRYYETYATMDQVEALAGGAPAASIVRSADTYVNLRTRRIEAAKAAGGVHAYDIMDGLKTAPEGWVSDRSGYFVPPDFTEKFENVGTIVLKDSPELRAAFEEAVNSDIQLLNSDSEIENRRGFAKAAGGIAATDPRALRFEIPEGWVHDPLIAYYVPPDFAAKYADLSKNRGNR